MKHTFLFYIVGLLIASLIFTEARWEVFNRVSVAPNPTAIRFTAPAPRSTTRPLSLATGTPTKTPAYSEIRLPTLAPTMGGPMGTLTAIAPLVASPVPDRVPYRIINRGYPHFVEFQAWWCSACNAMRPAIRRIENTYRDRIDFHLLNVDLPSTTPLAALYNVSAIPMIVLLHADGSLANILVGYQDEQTLAAAIEALLTEP